MTTANNILFRLLLGLVLLSPLPLGSARPLAWSLMAVLVALLLTGWGIAVLIGKARAPLSMARLWPVALPFALALGWAFLQTTSLIPAGWWHPLWTEAAQALGRSPAYGAVSVDPEMTLTGILRLVSYGGVFWLSVQLGRDRSRAWEALIWVALAGVAYAVYGLIVHFSGWERILWLEKWAYPGDLTATFVNRNAYGAYAGLGVVCCIALFIHALRPSRTGGERHAFEMAETVLVRALPYLVGAVVLGTALLLSHSRGAFLCTGLAVIVLMIALVAARIARPRTALILSVAMLGTGLAVLGVSGERTVQRLATTAEQADDEKRLDLYRLSARAIADAPLTGHGLGAFLPAFRMYRDTSLGTPAVWEYAHNVHLETFMDLGVPAAVLLYGSSAVVLGVCARGLIRRRRDRVYPAVAISAATLLAAHGVVDFSVQMPAIAATLALLLGVGYAQSWNTAEHGSTEA